MLTWNTKHEWYIPVKEISDLKIAGHNANIFLLLSVIFFTIGFKYFKLKGLIDKIIFSLWIFGSFISSILLSKQEYAHISIFNLRLVLSISFIMFCLIIYRDIKYTGYPIIQETPIRNKLIFPIGFWILLLLLTFICFIKPYADQRYIYNLNELDCLNTMGKLSNGIIEYIYQSGDNKLHLNTNKTVEVEELIKALQHGFNIRDVSYGPYLSTTPNGISLEELFKDKKIKIIVSKKGIYANVSTRLSDKNHIEFIEEK